MPEARKAERIVDPAFQSWFENKFKQSEECWIWTGALDRSGYGQVHYKKKLHGSASRFSYLLYCGDIPEDKLVVCHTCDTRACVAPHHLWLGTVKDNNDDMIQKNRHSPSKGETNGSAILTDDEILKIRVMYAEGGWTYEQIGAVFGVRKMAICNIIRRKTWKHI